jgi:hypothetical protein
LLQGQQQAGMVVGGNTSAAAAAVLNALVEGTRQQLGPDREGRGNSMVGDLQQGINRLVALLEGGSMQQANI